MLTRREFHTKIAASGLAACGLAAVAGAARPVLGTVRPRSAASVEHSPLGIGFETLDRKMFDPNKTYEPLSQLGVKWARVQTGWCRCETAKGKYDFAWLDEIVDRLLAVGLKPWFNLGYGNLLYTPEATNPFGVGWVPTRSDEARQAWVAFVRAIAEHFRKRVTHWEIWNEVNIAHFWKPEKPSPAGYVDLVKLTAPELRSRIPGVTLVGCALSGGPHKATTEYLKGCLDLGLGEHVDRISYHPYVLHPEKDYTAGIKEWRALLTRHKPSLALWQGECGCPSRPDGVGALCKYAWNESRQARWLLRRTLCDLRLGLEMISWYHTVDQVGYRTLTESGAKPAAGPNNAYFGLLRADDYSPKPSYRAYQTLAALFDAATVAADTPLQFHGGDPGGTRLETDKLEQAAFVRNGAPLLAYWSPTDVQKDRPTQSVRMTVQLPGDVTLREPVLIDPTSGIVTRLEGACSGRTWQFAELPLGDYPMLVTDAATALPPTPSSRK